MDEQTNPQSATRGLEPLAVGVEQAAALIGISRAQYYKLLKIGRVPVPVALGRRRVVSVDALRACLAA